MRGEMRNDYGIPIGLELSFNFQQNIRYEIKDFDPNSKNLLGYQYFWK